MTEPVAAHGADHFGRIFQVRPDDFEHEWAHALARMVVTMREGVEQTALLTERLNLVASDVRTCERCVETLTERVLVLIRRNDERERRIAAGEKDHVQIVDEVSERYRRGAMLWLKRSDELLVGTLGSAREAWEAIEAATQRMNAAVDRIESHTSALDLLGKKETALRQEYARLKAAQAHFERAKARAAEMPVASQFASLCSVLWKQFRDLFRPA